MLSLIARAPHPLVRHLPFPAERFEEVIGTGVVAERPGFDAYATGERHAGPFLSSSPSVVLGALAAPTSAIRLPTGVTVVAILDPVRMAEDFATLDPISGGRIERVVGKGAEAGHFSLLGLDEERRWDRRKEKHELPRRLWADESVEREGEFRPALKNTTPCRAPATGPLASGAVRRPASAPRAGRAARRPAVHRQRRPAPRGLRPADRPLPGTLRGVRARSPVGHRGRPRAEPSRTGRDTAAVRRGERAGGTARGAHLAPGPPPVPDGRPTRPAFRNHVITPSRNRGIAPSRTA
ncbi:LLM class flavin-dependent oxidoreductase [Streptomyces sp. NPDC001455]|uniref:LLM class flavin-dependent oxidoreductase n=1 Tax=unclassified Streptomyces TaxID=2593676 RepID=UPI003321E97E